MREAAPCAINVVRSISYRTIGARPHDDKVYRMVREPRAVYGRLRVYADTSVIGGCLDEEFSGPSRRLIERCASGEVTLVVSRLTLEELQAAPQAVREVLGNLSADAREVITITEEIEALFLNFGPLGPAVYPPVALHRFGTCVCRASRLIGSYCEYRVFLDPCREAKSAHATCASSSPIGRKTHTCRSVRRSLHSRSKRALPQTIYATFEFSFTDGEPELHATWGRKLNECRAEQALREIFSATGGYGLSGLDGIDRPRPRCLA